MGRGQAPVLAHVGLMAQRTHRPGQHQQQAHQPGQPQAPRQRPPVQPYLPDRPQRGAQQPQRKQPQRQGRTARHAPPHHQQQQAGDHVVAAAAGQQELGAAPGQPGPGCPQQQGHQPTPHRHAASLDVSPQTRCAKPSPAYGRRMQDEFDSASVQREGGRKGGAGRRKNAAAGAALGRPQRRALAAHSWRSCCSSASKRSWMRRFSWSCCWTKRCCSSCEAVFSSSWRRSDAGALAGSFL